MSASEDPTKAPKRKRGNPFAVVGLILGTVSFVFPGLGFGTIVFSIIGLIQASRPSGSGRIAAIAGLFLGVVFTVIALYG